MTIRVAIGGLLHETNTYATASTGLTTLDRFPVVRGEQLHRFAGTRTGPGGMLAAAGQLGIEVVPLLWTFATPSGTIARDAWAALHDELIERLRAAMPVDAVCLDLHGAAIVEDDDDPETTLGRDVREVIGPIPLVCILDLHGNIHDEMVDVYDLSLGYHLYPHTDIDERGHEAMSAIPALLEGRLRPVTRVEHLPMLLPTSTTDPGFPAARMNEVCAEVEAWPGVVDCTVFHGFPFTDIPGVGVHVVCTSDGDAELARAGARHVVSWVWDHREEFRQESIAPETALKLALARHEAKGGPVVINETSDNPGADTPGDGTYLLRAMLDSDVPDSCFGVVCDPDVVAQAMAAGVGAVVPIRLGAKHDRLHGEPIVGEGRVRCITDGRFVLQAMMAGTTHDLGPAVRLTIGHVDVVVVSRPDQVFDPEVFLLHGIDVRRCRLVGLKSSNHFRAGFRNLATAIVTADSPGLSTNRVEVFDHARARRPLWPTSPHAVWPES